MTAQSTAWRLLWAEGDPASIPQLRDEANRILDHELVWLRAKTLEEALNVLARETIDLVLLDLELPGSDGLTGFEQIRASDPTVPILALAAREDDPVAAEALSLGALDSLPKSEHALRLIAHSIRLGVHHARLQRELHEAKERERELMQMTELSQEPSAVSASMFGASPLNQTAPDVFDRLTRTYGDAVELAVEHLVHADDVDTSLILRRLSDELGMLRASPRDVIELHTRSLRTKIAEAHPKRARALIREGRLLVLELMGNLATFYRTNRA